MALRLEKVPPPSFLCCSGIHLLHLRRTWLQIGLWQGHEFDVVESSDLSSIRSLKFPGLLGVKPSDGDGEVLRK